MSIVLTWIEQLSKHDDLFRNIIRIIVFIHMYIPRTSAAWTQKNFRNYSVRGKLQGKTKQMNWNNYSV